jgi:hypothetical protein
MLQEEKPVLKLDSNLAARIILEGEVFKIDADGLYYKDLNCILRAVSSCGAKKAEIHGVCGQPHRADARLSPHMTVPDSERLALSERPNCSFIRTRTLVATR